MIKVIKKVANITLDIAIGAWMIFLISVFVMILSSCNSSSANAMEYNEDFSCENCDEID
mgnify:FL=1